MADKQIITKDVDARGCKFFRNGICASPINPKCKLCVEISEKMCYYKQLKRKQQECEKLKQTLTEIKPTLELYASSKIGEEQLDGTYKITVKNSSVLGDTYITFDPRPAKQALQKISECEV